MADKIRVVSWIQLATSVTFFYCLKLTSNQNSDQIAGNC